MYIKIYIYIYNIYIYICIMYVYICLYAVYLAFIIHIHFCHSLFIFLFLYLYRYRYYQFFFYCRRLSCACVCVLENNEQRVTNNFIETKPHNNTAGHARGLGAYCVDKSRLFPCSCLAHHYLRESLRLRACIHYYKYGIWQ